MPLRFVAARLPAPTGAGLAGEGLSPLAEELSGLLSARGRLTVAGATSATGANRNTIKDKFSELVAAGIAELHGKGRGAHYRPRGC